MGVHSAGGIAASDLIKPHITEVSEASFVCRSKENPSLHIEERHA